MCQLRKTLGVALEMVMGIAVILVIEGGLAFCVGVGDTKEMEMITYLPPVYKTEL